MIPKRVTLENFLSFGEKQEIVFDQDEVLWVIGGPNGVGKSAVFDAMTYCLFGTHRASGRAMKDRESNLIRHGASGFHISFEFEFAGIDYRITRNRKRVGKQPTQSVEQRKTDGSWERVPHVNDARELNDWVEKTLGLGCNAFQASVLLRQGKADEFVDAKPTERFEILKRIINLDRYETLSNVVHEATLARQRELKSYEKQREMAEVVTDDQLLEAETAEKEAEVIKDRSALTLESAISAQATAKAWGELEIKRQTVMKWIASAEQLQANAASIQDQYTRYLQLNDNLPRLKMYFTLQQKMAQAEPQLLTLQKQRHAAEARQSEVATKLLHANEAINTSRQWAKTAGIQVEQITAAIARQQQFLEATSSLSKLGKQLQEFPATLDKESTKAKSAHTKAVELQAKARDEVARLSGLKEVALQHQKAISKLKVGVHCSACGQPVTAEHAKKERTQATKQVNQYTAELDTAEAAYQKAETDATGHAKLMESLQKEIKKRDQLQQQYDVSRQNLASLGTNLDARALQKELAELKAQLEQQQLQITQNTSLLTTQQTLVKQLDADSKAAEKELRHATEQYLQADKELAGDRGQSLAIRDHLPPNWTTLQPGNLASMEAELKEFLTKKIAEHHQQLQEANGKLNVWQQNLTEYETALAAIPETARITVAQAEQAETVARAQLKQSEAAWQSARDRFQSLLHKAKAIEQLRQQIGQQEQDAALHAELDALLGKGGLQRDLMRDAELQIVNLAHQTLQQLTDGELALELNENKDDEALNLCVRGASATLPTPLDYLSGSQKFRVAIAIALAIGRYSTGHSRPLESVIIDEGFGSLDKDGLIAMAEELKQLQRKQSLRRIILVSHQEDFVDLFRAGYALTPDEKGTVAKVWRK